MWDQGVCVGGGRGQVGSGGNRYFESGQVWVRVGGCGGVSMQKSAPGRSGWGHLWNLEA